MTLEEASQAKDDPLTAARLDIEYVTNVFYVDHWITVTQDGRADWQEFDFREMAVTMTTDGAEIVASRGGHAFGDPFLPLVVLANIMRRRDGLKAGQLLATGSFTGFFQVEPGRTIVADFAGFGSVSARFV